MPSALEVAQHVREHWIDWGGRLARISGHSGQVIELVSIENVSCSYTFTTPECSLDVTGRIALGPVVRQRMFTQFDRSKAGNLKEVIVLFHERRRRSGSVAKISAH